MTDRCARPDCDGEPVIAVIVLHDDTLLLRRDPTVKRPHEIRCVDCALGSVLRFLDPTPIPLTLHPVPSVLGDTPQEEAL